MLAALAAFAITSCQKNEVLVDSDSEGDPIAFGVYSGRTVTKASEPTNVIGIDSLKRMGLGVFAFYTGQDTWSSYSSKTTPNFMNNTQVKWDYTNKKWVYSPIKYWPNNTSDKVSFFAYAPYDASKVWNSSNPYTHFVVNETVLSQVDLLFALGLTDKTKQSGKDSLLFAFKHALSKVGLQVAYVRDSTTYEKADTAKIESATVVVIDSVYLTPKTSGFYKEGDVDMTASSAAAAWKIGTTPTYHTVYKLGSEKNFKSHTAAATNHAAGQIVVDSLVQLNNDNSYIMMIPQDFSSGTYAAGVDVTVKYHVWTADSKLSGGYSKITNKITTNFKLKFEAGKAYTLNLLLGLNSVKIKATVDDWTDVTPGTDVYLPANN